MIHDYYVQSTINDDADPLPTIDEFGISLNVTDDEGGFELVSITENGTSVEITPDQPVTVIEDGKTGYEFVEIRGEFSLYVLKI